MRKQAVYGKMVFIYRMQGMHHTYTLLTQRERERQYVLILTYHIDQIIMMTNNQFDKQSQRKRANFPLDFVYN